MTRQNLTWIISEYYSPSSSSTGYYMTEIAEYLSRNTCNVHVICTNSKYHQSEKVFVPKEEFINGVHIHRILIRNKNKNKFFTRLLSQISTSLRLFIKILYSVKKNDRILIVTNPAFLILFMSIIKFLKGVNYYVLVYDVFPENLVALKTIKHSSLTFMILQKMYNSAYSRASICIAIGRDMKEIILAKIKNESKIRIITNWADTENIRPIKKSDTKLIRNLNLGNRFVFQFAGNLGNLQGIDNIIRAIKEVNNENIHFLFIGSGAKEELILDYINNNCKNNVSLVGFQKRELQQDFINACDVALVTLGDGMFGLGVPSKSYNIMAAGKPLLVIADKNSEISLCVSDYNLGWTIEPNEPHKLSNAFEKIYHEYLNEGFTKFNTREVAETQFSKRIILEKYNSLFSQSSECL